MPYQHTPLNLDTRVRCPPPNQRNHPRNPATSVQDYSIENGHVRNDYTTVTANALDGRELISSRCCNKGASLLRSSRSEADVTIIIVSNQDRPSPHYYRGGDTLGQPTCLLSRHPLKLTVTLNERTTWLELGYDLDREKIKQQRDCLHT